MIGTILFDMDGLLVDSEPFWKIAEKEVFGSLGLNLDDELLRQVMGFRLSEVVEHWYRYQAWPNANFRKTENDILDSMEKFMREGAIALPGIMESLEAVKEKGYACAVASSSSMRLIETVVDKLNIRSYFDLLYSAEYEAFGKPHPGIFISAANKLGSAPVHCLVLEDSVNGVIAAKAARMTCIAVPEKEKFEDPRFSIADYRLRSMEEFPDLIKKL
ncbi:MAG: hexitol phosphatase HxpB [Bacteroidia bacterium]|nr:hexitol phosphatase HxpB [Bacteroidia bacterium]MCF8425753.1 hexitol phosphatase HxpB [Bacteroidia bacterium]MCF8447032.1 hexitol phosphatase HxpB [Bacteroidia bacterium]